MNGRRVCLAGIARQGVLSAMVDRVAGEWVERIHLTGGALEGTEHMRWAVPPIGVGDEVLIRVSDAPAADPPSERR